MTGQTLVDLVEHLRGMESSFTSILFEAALKLASITDTSVFLLVETAEGRKFGGKQHLCDSYVGEGLQSKTNDVQCSVDLSGKSLQQHQIQSKQQPDLTRLPHINNSFAPRISSMHSVIMGSQAGLTVPPPLTSMSRFNDNCVIDNFAAAPALPVLQTQFSNASFNTNNNVGSSNKRKQSKPKSLSASQQSLDDGVSPNKVMRNRNDGDENIFCGGIPPIQENGLPEMDGCGNDDVIEVKREPNASNQFFAIDSFGGSCLSSDSPQILDKIDGGLVQQKPLCNDLDGMVLDLFGGNQIAEAWSMQRYLASNMKVSAMLNMEPLIDTSVDPNCRELTKHSAFMKMLSSVLYDASKEAAIACPVKCKSDPSSKNFFSVVFEDLFAFFPNLNDLHIRGFRCPEGTRSYSVKTFCRNIMQRSFGFFLDKMR